MNIVELRQKIKNRDYGNYGYGFETLEEKFKEEAIEAVGLKGNPKADLAYSLALEYGGDKFDQVVYLDVLDCLIDLAKLVL